MLDDTCKACREVCGLESIDVLVRDMRPALLRAIEKLRSEGTIKHSLEASVHVYIAKDSSLYELWRGFTAFAKEHKTDVAAFMKELLIVSDFVMHTELDEAFEATALKGLHVHVTRAAGVKCPRCWQWSIDSNLDGLCRRCAAVIE